MFVYNHLVCDSNDPPEATLTHLCNGKGTFLFHGEWNKWLIDWVGWLVS